MLLPEMPEALMIMLLALFRVMLPVVTAERLLALVLRERTPEAEVKEIIPAEMVPEVSEILPEPLAFKVTLEEPEILEAPWMMEPLLAVVSRTTEEAERLPAREILLLSNNWKV